MQKFYRNRFTLGSIPQLDAVVPSFLPKDNLIAYYKLDETSGTTLVDSLNSYNGSINGATINQTGKIGKCHSLDGTNDYYTVSGLPAFDTDFSISCWYKRSSSGSNDYLFGRGTTSTDQGLHFGFRSTNVLSMGFYADDLDTTATYTDTTSWHHIVFTYKYSTREQKLYYDNQLVGSRIGTGNPNFGTGAFYIGATPWMGSSDYAAGLLDEIAIYRGKTLSSAEVSQIWNGGLGVTF